MVLQTLVSLHLAIGFGLLALLVAITVLAVPAAVRGQPPPPLYRTLHRVAAGAIVAEVVVGLVLLGLQARPRDNLHLVYGAAALLVMPVARLLVRADRGKARVYQVGGTVLLLGVLFRLVTTG
jgi:hypothetical protein